MEVRLSARMRALAALVTEGNRLADVGTDHGYIPIALVEAGRIPSAIAMDIREGPLGRARENIAARHLEGRITTRLSDGLCRLGAGEADTVLIAGMGGFLVRRILADGADVLGGVRELILQPQSEIPQVRTFLRERGYVIADEDMVFEDGKFYPMMRAVRGTREGDFCGPQDLFDEEYIRRMEDCFGPVLLKNAHPVLLAWMEREQELLERIRERLSRQGRREQAAARRREVDRQLQLLSDARRLMRG